MSLVGGSGHRTSKRPTRAFPHAQGRKVSGAEQPGAAHLASRPPPASSGLAAWRPRAPRSEGSAVAQGARGILPRYPRPYVRLAQTAAERPRWSSLSITATRAGPQAFEAIPPPHLPARAAGRCTASPRRFLVLARAPGASGSCSPGSSRRRPESARGATARTTAPSVRCGAALVAGRPGSPPLRPLPEQKRVEQAAAMLWGRCWRVGARLRGLRGGLQAPAESGRRGVVSCIDRKARLGVGVRPPGRPGRPPGRPGRPHSPRRPVRAPRA